MVVRNPVQGSGLRCGCCWRADRWLLPKAGAGRPDQDGPPSWDTNHDGVFTCEEYKSFLDRIFTFADKNHDGRLDPTEFETVRKADPSLADADFGYFDENQDGKITRKEFVEKPSPFFLKFDKNGDCASPPMKSRRGWHRRVRRDRPSGRATDSIENG